MKLTELKIKNTKPKKKPYKLYDGNGLYLRVMPTGSKYWRYDYRFNKKPKTLSIGVYPNISLKVAREKRFEARKLLDEHKDPSLEKQKAKLTAHLNSENTFEAVARDWYETHLGKWKPRYAQEIIKRLEEDIFPNLGHYPITDIEAPLLLAVIRKIEGRGAIELAKRQRQKCSEIFRHGIACGMCNRDPAHDITAALKSVKTNHYACIEIDELPKLLDEISMNRARLYITTQNALKLMLLTFVRTSELINATWDEIDLERKEWIIPAERMKMGNPHIVPLSDQAIKILEDQKIIAGHWPLVFPSSVKPKQSISNNTILGGLKRLGYHKRMTGHGFRALAMSAIKEKLGYRHEVVDRQLAHAPKSKIDRAYDRAKFLDERCIMMQDWADYIDHVSKTGNVHLPKDENG